MILTGKEILRQMEIGNIVIDPFEEKRINANSVNLRLHDTLLVYDLPLWSEPVKHEGTMRLGPVTYMEPLDPKIKTPTKELVIPEEGLVLYPGILYLGKTLEYTETHNLFSAISGRSSTGRNGINIHVTAGFGDVGFCGNWTLELFVVQPVKVYPHMEICQMYYHDVKGEITTYNGKYQGLRDITPSKMHEDFK